MRAYRPGPAANEPRPGTSGETHARQRPELEPRQSAAYATINATPEEIEKIEAIEAEGRTALDRIPDDVVGDDRMNAVLLAEQDKSDALADLLGEQRARWYLKIRADELEPEVTQLLMPPADAGVPAPPQHGQ